MGPGYVQGGTRAPPDHPEDATRGELYSICLWRTPWGKCGMRNADCGMRNILERLLEVGCKPGNLKGKAVEMPG